MKKIYLDYNIWDEINKNSDTKAFFQSLEDASYYISVAHLEELLHARNNENETHKGCSNNLKELMLSMAVPGIITYNNSISFDPTQERFNSALQSIEVKHDTQELIAKISEEEFDNRDEETKTGFKGIEGIKTEDLYMHIWNDPIIIQKINKMNEIAREVLRAIQNFTITPFNAIQYMPLAWRQEYETDDNAGFLAYEHLLARTKTITKGCYDEIKDNCVYLEDIIEILNSFLLDRGFYQDTKLRTYTSGKYDLQHFIMSTYCEIFVTKDKRFCERAKAIAYYLGIPLEIKLWKNGQLI